MANPLRPALRLALLLCILYLLAGCGSMEKKPPPSATTPPPDPELVALESQGEYRALAERYLSLEGSDAEVSEWRLRAAEAYIRAGDHPAAEQVVDTLPAAALSPEQQNRANLVRAQAAAAGGDLSRALSLLPPSGAPLPPSQAAQAQWLRSQWLGQSGDSRQALQARLQLDDRNLDPAQQEANRLAIWQLLMAMPRAEREALAARQPELQPWLALEAVFQIPINEPYRLADAASQWRSRYPGHPADTVLQVLQRSADQALDPPLNVGLMLPLSGPLAGAGEAIRDGFLAAHYSIPGQRPEIRMYDTGSDSAASLYRQAESEGVDHVVGPLRKEQVAEIATLVSLSLPVLALNRIDDAPSPDLMTQFGLAPEDDAESVADRALNQGLYRAIVLTPSNSWGRRVNAAFEDRYIAGGGTILAAAGFDPDGRDFREPITRVGGVSASQERYQALRNTLGRQIEFEPQRRSDADLLFLAAFPVQARSLVPQLAFYRVEDLPVLATSHIYQGSPNPGLDQDLNGVWFTETPWLLNDPQTEAMRTMLAGMYPEQMRTAPRLYALGVDAYQLMALSARLRELPGARYKGATGVFHVDTEGRVQRELGWARFVGGVPRPEGNGYH